MNNESMTIEETLAAIEQRKTTRSMPVHPTSLVPARVRVGEVVTIGNETWKRIKVNGKDLADGVYVRDAKRRLWTALSLPR